MWSEVVPKKEVYSIYSIYYKIGYVRVDRRCHPWASQMASSWCECAGGAADTCVSRRGMHVHRTAASGRRTALIRWLDIRTLDISSSYGGCGCETTIIYAVGISLGVIPPWVAGVWNTGMKRSRTVQDYTLHTSFSYTLREAGLSGYSRVARAWGSDAIHRASAPPLA